MVIVFLSKSIKHTTMVYVTRFFIATIAFLATIHSSVAQWTSLTQNVYTNIVLEDVYAQGSRVIAVGTDISTFSGCILTSTDSGSTWDSTITNSGYLLKGIAFADDNTGVIAVLGGIPCTMRSTDGGSTWEWNWCDVNSAGVYDIGFIDGSVGYMGGYDSVQFQDGAIFKTTDAGESWTNVSGKLDNMPFEYIQFLDEDHGFGGSFLFGNQSLYKTSDGGVTWDSIDVSAEGCSGVHFFDAQEGILLGSNGWLYRTFDAGQQWTQIGQPDPGVVDWTNITFVTDSIGYAFGQSSFATAIVLKTEDRGNTWVNESFPTSDVIVKTRAYQNRVYAVSDFGGVFVSAEIDTAGNGGGSPSGVLNPNAVKGVLHAFPNPVSTTATLVLDEAVSGAVQVEVFNSLGQTVALPVHRQDDRTVVLDCTDLSVGSYYYSVNTGDRMYSGHLLKTH